LLTLNLSEVFTSFQGEGPYTGQYALFIRFAGCNLDCSYCDTVHKRDKINIQISVEELEKQINQGRHRHLVLTGGEALLRIDELRAIKAMLRQRNIFVEVETNGTITVPEDLWDWHFNISPKVWTAHTYTKIILPPNSTLKFPVNRENLKETITFIDQHQFPNDKIYLMPMCTTYDEYVVSSRDIMQTLQDRQWNFSTRLQVIHNIK
jgi:7-carboxy-7-deazaguanine synthase